MSATKYGSSVQELEELVKKGMAARQRFEPDWYQNVAYYSGNQWLIWRSGRFLQPNLERWRVTFTDNRIIGIVRTEVAKLTKQRPIFVVTPTTGEEEDIASSELGERILRYLWNHMGLSAKHRAALTWSRTCGAGFWKVCWDPTLGDETEVFVDQQGQPVIGDDGRPLRSAGIPTLPPEQAGMYQRKTIAAGDVSVEVRSPFEVVVDPLATEVGLDSAEWMIEQCVRSKEYVRKRFGVELVEDADAIQGIAESRFAGAGLGGLATGSTSAYRGVKVSEYWARPSSKFPKGKRCVWAGGKILLEDSNPYDSLPYVMFTGVPVPGRFWPTSTVEQLRPVQTELNKTRSQIRENAARIGNPALLVSRYANISYTGVPGERVEFDDTTQNAVPSYLHAPEMPGYVQNEIDRMENSMREISGQHEVSNASVPTGVTAASAISLLQEQDDTRLGPDIADMEGALALAGRKVLTLVARFYNDQRTVRIAGEDGDWDIFEFRGSQLGGNTHVEVQAGSSLPLSKAAKTAAMQDVLNLFLQYGVPLGRRDLAQYLRDMQVGGFDRLIDEFSEDEAQVNRENRRLAAGFQLPINAFDVDEAHVAGHTGYQKSSRWDQLDPRVQQSFEIHVDMHRQRMAQTQAAAALVEQQPPGAPQGGAQGPPSGPPPTSGRPQGRMSDITKTRN